MSEDEEVEIAVAARPDELREALGDCIQNLSELQAELAKAKAIAGSYEGIGDVLVDYPDLKNARQAIKDLHPKIEAAERRIDDFKRRLVERIVENDRAEREGRDFWFRRFMLSLQIGNGAAFLATITGLLQADKDVLPVMAKVAWAAGTSFAVGVTAAGLLPLVMFARSVVQPPYTEWLRQAVLVLLTGLSMSAFAFGAWSVVVEVERLRTSGSAAAISTRAAEMKSERGPVEPPPVAATQKRAEDDTVLSTPRPEVRPEQSFSEPKKPS